MSTDTNLFKDLKNQNAELIYVLVEKLFITFFVTGNIKIKILYLLNFLDDLLEIICDPQVEKR